MLNSFDFYLLSYKIINMYIQRLNFSYFACIYLFFRLVTKLSVNPKWRHLCLIKTCACIFHQGISGPGHLGTEHMRHLGTRYWTSRYWKFRYWTSRYWKFRYWIIKIIWLNLKTVLIFFTCRRCLFRYWIINIIWLNLKTFKEAIH